MKLLLLLLAVTAFGQRTDLVCRTPECGRAVLKIVDGAADQYGLRQSDGCLYFHHASGYDTPLVGGSSTGIAVADTRCPAWRQRAYEYRIDWLKPKPRFRPVRTKYDLGVSTSLLGDWGDHIYLSAPRLSIVISMPDGKRVEITRRELDGRAK